MIIRQILYFTFFMINRKSRGAVCDQMVSLRKKWKNIDPHNFFYFGGGLFSSAFFIDSPFGHKWHFKIEPPPFSPFYPNIEGALF